MKKMKTLALLFLAVIISSAGLTSCIDENVDPAVQGIYTNQALLLLSQANLNDANATYALAKANLQDAYAAAALSAAADASAESAQDILSQAAQTAINVAQAAQFISEREAYLAQQIAMAAIALDHALIALEAAQLQWQLDMIALQASIDDAYVALASGYFNDYTAAKNMAIAKEGEAIMKQSEIDMAQLLINTGASPDVTWAYYLAQQENILTGLQNDLAAKEAAVVSLEAVIADPSTAASQSSALQAMQDDNDAAIDALDIDIAELEADLVPLYAAAYDIMDLDSDYHNAMYDVEYYQDEVDDLQEDNADLADEIADLEALIASYPTDLADAEAAVVVAADALVAAEDALVAAEDAKVITEDELAAADLVVTEADDALTVLEDIIDTLEGSLNAAAADLANEQSIYDAGIGAATTAVTTAGADVTNAENAVTAAIVVYETWRDRFEGGPTVNGGFYWEDTTSPSVILADDVLGLQTDDTGTAVASYVRVESWMYNGVDDNTPLTYGVVVGTNPGTLIAGNGVLTDAEVAAAYPNGTVEYYIEVGLDDESSDNLAEFQAATTALGNEDIMDVPPVLGDTATGGADAYSVLWDAMLAEIEAIDALANFGVALAAAQLVYDDLKVIYENEVLLLVAAQDVLAAAVAAQIPFADADAAAAIVVADAIVAVADADAAVVVADDDLASLLGYTPADMQDEIDDKEHEIVENNIHLAEYEPMLANAIAILAELEVALVDAGLGIEYTAIIDLENQIDALEDQQDALYMMNYQMDLVIWAIAIDNGDLQDDLDYLLMDISSCQDAIEAQQVVIAVGQVDETAAQAAITQLENQLAEILAQVDGYNALATKYWDLMLAALAA